MATDKEQEDWAIAAAKEWIKKQPQLDAYDVAAERPDGVLRRNHGKPDKWYVIFPDSPWWYVWDRDRLIRAVRIRENAYERRAPTSSPEAPIAMCSSQVLHLSPWACLGPPSRMSTMGM